MVFFAAAGRACPRSSPMTSQDVLPKLASRGRPNGRGSRWSFEMSFQPCVGSANEQACEARALFLPATQAVRAEAGRRTVRVSRRSRPRTRPATSLTGHEPASEYRPLGTRARAGLALRFATAARLPTPTPSTSHRHIIDPTSPRPPKRERRLPHSQEQER